MVPGSEGICFSVGVLGIVALLERGTVFTMHYASSSTSATFTYGTGHTV